MSGRVIAVLALLAAIGCSNAGEESKVRRSPVSPPPPKVEVPADLRIPVEVDGAEGSPITADLLARTRPHYADDERRAWRLSELLRESPGRAGDVVEAIGPAGMAVSMEWPEGDGDVQPVLFLTRRGDVVATAIDPNEPFPVFHGHGGRLKRPGTTLPRITPVQRLRIRPGN